MRNPRRSAASLVLGVVALTVPLGACSLFTTWDGLSSSDGTANGDAETHHDTGAGITDSGASTDLGDAGPIGPDASDDAACPAGGYYCGGSGSAGDPSALYECGPTGVDKIALTCSHGCVHRGGGADTCICTRGGHYCGNDQVLGDPQNLYTCNGDAPPTLLMACLKGCAVNIGVDDSCQ